MRRAARILIIAASIATGALLALAAVLLVFEFTIPLERSKQWMVQALSKAVGGEVSLNGKLSLVTGPRPRIEATELEVARPFARYRLNSRVSLVGIGFQVSPLLAGNLRLANMEIGGGSLCLTPYEGKPQPAPDPNAAGEEPRWYLPQVERILIQNFDLIVGPDCDQVHEVLHVASLEWTVPSEGDPRIQARGGIEEEPWSAELSGPLLASLARGPASFRLAVEVAAARLEGNGTASLFPLTMSADIALDSQEFSRIISLAGASLKGFGPLSMRGHVAADASKLALRVDEAQLKPGMLSGDFSILWSQPRPQIRARARSPGFAALALEQWLLGSLEFEKGKRQGVPEWLTKAARDTEGELSLAVEHLKLRQVALGAATYESSWRDGKVDAKIAGTIGNRPIDGTLNLDLSADVATVSGNWGISEVTLPQELGVSGTIGSLESQVSGRAGPGETIAQSLHITFAAKDARLLIQRDQGKPFPLPLRSLRADWRAQEALRLDVSGAPFGEPSNLRVEGPDAWRLFQGESWAMKSSGNLGTLQFTAKGKVSLPAAGPKLDLAVSATAGRLGALAGGVDTIARLPATLKGNVSLADGRWKADVASVRLGKSRGRGKLEYATRPAPQPIDAQVALDVLDVVELAGPPRKNRDPDREVIRGNLSLPDANLALDVARLALPGGIEPKVALSAKTRGGRLEIAPFSAALDGSRIDGSIKADLTAAKPGISAALRGSALEGKHFERWLRAAGWYFNVGSGELDISTSGSRPGELAANADYRLHAQDVRLAHFDSRERTLAELSQLVLIATPGKPAALSADGIAAGSPLSLKAKVDRFDKLWLGGETPFQAEGNLAQLGWRATGRLPLEFGSARRLQLHASAERLDALSGLLEADLPPVGPLALDAVLTGGERELSADVKIAVGESKAAGRISRKPGDRPYYAMDLTAPLLRVEDLGLKHWRDEPATNQTASRPKTESGISRKDTRAPEEDVVQALRRFDARVDFKAERVTAQGSLLGSGELEATLKAGHLSAPRIRIKTPDGGLTASADADFSSDPPRLQARADVPRFRYGPLLKALDFASEDQGELSLKFDLSANARLAHIAPHLNGSLDLLVFPTERRVKGLDRLGAGLLSVLMDTFDSDLVSKLNCAVGSFSISDGIAKSNTILLDATRVRAAGELEINLETEALKGIIAPKSKRPAVFTADVALQIGGTLRNPQISTAPQEIAMAAARNIYYAYGFVFDVLTRKDVPADGSADCRAIYQRVSK